MNREEPHQEEDPRRFEKITRKVREEQSPSTGDEGTEEERRQWEKTCEHHAFYAASGIRTSENAPFYALRE
jgi:hypothetical protein